LIEKDARLPFRNHETGTEEVKLGVALASLNKDNKNVPAGEKGDKFVTPVFNSRP